MNTTQICWRAPLLGWTALVLGTVGALTPGEAEAQESVEELVKVLSGREFQTKGQGRTRSLVPTEPEPAPQTTTRSVFLPRGAPIPEEVQAFSLHQKNPSSPETARAKPALRVQETTTGEKELSYGVNPATQLSNQSIKFVQGGIDPADQKSQQFLNNLATALKHPALKDSRFVIEGHASREGGDLLNLRLSQRRAQFVYAFLQQNGIPPSRIVPVGHGEKHASAAESDPESERAKDRRVVLFKLEPLPNKKEP